MFHPYSVSLADTISDSSGLIKRTLAQRSFLILFKVEWYPEGNVWVSAALLKTRGGQAI